MTTGARVALALSGRRGSLPTMMRSTLADDDGCHD
jgi:hypothetical protein